jgi:type II secretory pathway pseudopilin PulG
MALDKKQIALTVGGILAGLTLTYLLYRLEQNNAATAAANAANASAEAESQLANQQAEVASLPAISVPTISSTPSTTPSTSDTSNQSQTSSIDPGLESIIASLLSQDNTSTTTQQSPSAQIAQLPIPTGVNIAPVVIPTLQTNFGGNPVSSPISVSGTTSYANTQSEGSNGVVYNTNVARGASLASS